MIEPGFITDELSQDYTFALRVAVETGVRHVEVRSFSNLTPHQISDERLEEVGRQTRGAGITVQVFCSPFGKCKMPTTDAEISEASAHLEAEVERCVKVGARYMRIFPFIRQNDPKPCLAASALAKIIDQVDVPPGLLILENGTISNAPNLEMAAMVLQCAEAQTVKMRQAAVGLLWDPGNAVFSGYSDDFGEPNFTKVLQRVRHVHIKDYADGAYVVVGKGTINWAQVFGMLRKAEFGGVASLETHARDGRVLAKKLRDQPWADAFSEGGFAPTLKSLFALQEILA